MQLAFRRATPVDAADLTRLAVRAKASWGYPAEWLQEWLPQLTFSAAYIDTNPVIVALLDGAIVGVVALEDRGEPEIGHLWVAPDHQGQGVGQELLRRATEVAATRRWHTLRIESDPHAVSFYERCGAELVGEVDAPVCGSDRSLPVLQLKIEART